MNTTMRTMDAAIVLCVFDVSLISLDRNRLLGKSPTYSAPKEKMASIPIFRATVRCSPKIYIDS